MPTLVSQHTHAIAQCHGCVGSSPRGVIVPEDAVRREANRAYSELLWAWRRRRWALYLAFMRSMFSLVVSCSFDINSAHCVVGKMH
jgi:hypothetical protein